MTEPSKNGLVAITESSKGGVVGAAAPRQRQPLGRGSP